MGKLKQISIVMCLVMACNLFITAFSAPFNRDTPPRVIEHLRDVEVLAGKTISLQCRAIGTPKPVCTVYKDDKPIIIGDRVTFKEDGDTYTLTIVNAKMDDSGVYTFRFTNPAGQVVTSAKVLVQKRS